jgi:L-ascorbate metabolism protein UlaG (beta-lactamase superfamily)
MKITKFVHSCLLVEMPAPINRTALFDPGSFSEEALDVDALEYLDDIIITHQHGDHLSLPLVKELVAKFPKVHVTAPPEVVDILRAEGITASSEPSDGIVFFDAPHENVEPLFPRPQNLGVHYLDKLSHPGDSHSFTETKPVLALPLAGPWASTIRAINLAIQLKPQYVLPIHDWHWNEAARQSLYKNVAAALDKEGIIFVPLTTGNPETINI